MYKTINLYTSYNKIQKYPFIPVTVLKAKKLKLNPMIKGNYFSPGSENYPTCFYQVKPAETKRLHNSLPLFY